MRVSFCLKICIISLLFVCSDIRRNFLFLNALEKGFPPKEFYDINHRSNIQAWMVCTLTFTLKALTEYQLDGDLSKQSYRLKSYKMFWQHVAQCVESSIPHAFPCLFFDRNNPLLRAQLGPTNHYNLDKNLASFSIKKVTRSIR